MKFVATGFAFSSVKPNDPAVTGFQSIKYKPPFRIKYVDINVVLKDGFEAVEPGSNSSKNLSPDSTFAKNN